MAESTLDTSASASASGWVSYIPPGSAGKMPWPGHKSIVCVLGALCAVAAVTLAWAVPHFEYRLDRMSKDRLERAGIDTNSLNFSWNYRDLKLTGVLPPSVTVEQLATVLRQKEYASPALFANGMRQLQLELHQPDPVVAEYAASDQSLRVSALVSQAEVELNGVVQTEVQRDRLVDAALRSGVERINDNLEVAIENRPEPGGDTKIGTLADILVLSGPHNVVAAQIELDEDHLNYHITAHDNESAAAIETAAAITLIDFQVTGKLDLIKNGEVDVIARSDGSRLLLQGSVLSAEQRRRLAFAVGEAVGSENIIDRLEVSDLTARVAGADERIASMANLLTQFSPGVKGEVALKGTTLKVNATVASEQVRAYMIEMAAVARRDGLTVVDNLSLLNEKPVSDVVLLQRELNELADEIRANVVFGSGNTNLTRAAKITLDSVVEKMAGYPDLQIEVEGHTDNVGRSSVNERLSQQRANSVREYLIGKQIASDRLVAVGYGDRKPIDSNDTTSGRQRNRRVHFHVVKSLK